MADYSKWCDTNQLVRPTAEDLLHLNSKHLEGIAYSLFSSAEIDELDDYGQLSFELVMLLLEQISSRMSPGQTLRDYLSRL